MTGRCPGPFQWTGGRLVKISKSLPPPPMCSRLSSPSTARYLHPLALVLRYHPIQKRLASDVCFHFWSWTPSLTLASFVTVSLFGSVVWCWISFAILFFLIRRCFCFCVFSNGLHLVWIIARFLLDQSSLCTDTSYTATSSFEILTRNTCAKLGYASSLYSRKRN